MRLHDVDWFVWALIGLVALGLISFSIVAWGDDVLVCNQDKSRCNYVTKPSVGHDHYKHGYRIRHSHPLNGTLEEHYEKEEPLYLDHYHDQTEFPKTSESEKYKLEEKPIETEPKIETKKYRIEIEVVPWLRRGDEHETAPERPII